MKYIVVTEPQTEPLTLLEAKLHLRVTNTVEDGRIGDALTSARRYIEGFVGPLITQTIDQYFNCFPACSLSLELAVPNVQSITSISYTDSTDATSTVSASTYQLSSGGYGKHGFVVLKYGQSWPTVTLQTVDAVKVRMVAGFGDEAEDVPAEIIQAMYLTIGHFYQNREEELRGNNTVPSRLQMGVFALIDRYRTHR